MTSFSGHSKNGNFGSLQPCFYFWKILRCKYLGAVHKLCRLKKGGGIKNCQCCLVKRRLRGGRGSKISHFETTFYGRSLSTIYLDKIITNFATEMKEILILQFTLQQILHLPLVNKIHKSCLSNILFLFFILALSSYFGVFFLAKNISYVH